MSAAGAADGNRGRAVWWASLVAAFILGAALARELDWDVVWRYRVYLMQAAVNTGLYAAGSIAAGLLLGTLFAAARFYGRFPLRQLAAACIEFVRATPQLMVILWIYFVIPELTRSPLSPERSAYLSLTIIATAYLAEVIRAGLDSIPRIQLETGYTTGLTRMQIFAYIVLPQALRNMLPALIATFVMLFKTTTLVYVIGISDFFFAANVVNTREIIPYTTYALLGLFYFVSCYALSALVRRLDPKYILQS